MACRPLDARPSKTDFCKAAASETVGRTFDGTSSRSATEARCRNPLSSASKSKSLHPLAQGRRLRRLRGTTLIRLGPHSRCPMPFIRPVTRARRNPLLGFRGSRLGGEFSKIWVGSHHPPTLYPECWSQPPAPFSSFKGAGCPLSTFWCPNRCLLLLVVAATTSVRRLLVSTGVAYPRIS